MSPQPGDWRIFPSTFRLGRKKENFGLCVCVCVCVCVRERERELILIETNILKERLRY